jgi:type II secretory pathway pseudopilin PulG
MEHRSHTRQMIGSLLVAVAIVALAIVVVTARFGSTSAAEREVQEERLDHREELREERREAREERREERQRLGEP